jgi:hypothetical protein
MPAIEPIAEPSVVSPKSAKFDLPWGAQRYKEEKSKSEKISERQGHFNPQKHS